MLRKVFSIMMAFLMAFSPEIAYAQGLWVSQLPQPGVSLRASLPMTPVLFKGLVLFPDQPLHFRVLVGQGDGAIDSSLLKDESIRMMKYFLAAVTVPAEDQWVNLSPYEQERMVPEELGFTELGRDLLAQDYVLKQFTASLLSPDTDLGRTFWKQARAQGVVGDEVLAAEVYNKVWVMPDVAEIYEQDQSVYVTRARLKVMLDSDYTAGQVLTQGVLSADNSVSREKIRDLMRSMIVPVIEKEINEGAQFAVARQIYHAGILASWYRGKIKDSLMAKVYMDQARVQGVDLNDKTLKEQIYQRYIEAYKKGVVNFIREEEDSVTGRIVPRRYFSGGMAQVSLPPASIITRVGEVTDSAMGVSVDFAARTKSGADSESMGPYASVQLLEEEKDALASSQNVMLDGKAVTPGEYYLTLKEIVLRLTLPPIYPQGARRRKALVVGRADNGLTVTVFETLIKHLNLELLEVDPSRIMNAANDSSISISPQIAVRFSFMDLRVNSDKNLTALKNLFLKRVYQSAANYLGDDAVRLLRKTVAEQLWRQGRVVLTNGDEVSVWEAKRVFQEIVRIENSQGDLKLRSDLRILVQFLARNNPTHLAIFNYVQGARLIEALDELNEGVIVNAEWQISPAALSVLRSAYNFDVPGNGVVLDPVLDGHGTDYKASVLVDTVERKEIAEGRPVSPYAAVVLTPQETQFLTGKGSILFNKEYVQLRVVYTTLKEMLLRLAVPQIINQGVQEVLVVGAPGIISRRMVTEFLQDKRFSIVYVNPKNSFGLKFPAQIGVMLKWNEFLSAFFNVRKEMLQIQEALQERVIAWADQNLPDEGVGLLLQARRDFLQQEGMISLRRTGEQPGLGVVAAVSDVVDVWREILSIEQGSNVQRKKALHTLVDFLRNQEDGGVSKDTHLTNEALQAALNEIRKGYQSDSWRPGIVMHNNEVLPHVADLLRSSFDRQSGKWVLVNPVEGENLDPKESSLSVDNAQKIDSSLRQNDFAFFPVAFTEAEIAFARQNRNVSIGGQDYKWETVYAAAKDIAVRLAAARISSSGYWNFQMILGDPGNAAMPALVQMLLKKMNLESFEIPANKDYPAQIAVRFSEGFFFQHSRAQMVKARNELLQRLDVWAEELMGKEGKHLLAEAVIAALWREGKVILRSSDEVSVTEAAPLYSELVAIETGAADSPQRAALHILADYLAKNKLEPKAVKTYWNKEKLLGALDVLKGSLFVDQDKNISLPAQALLRSAFVVYEGGEVFLRDPVANGAGVAFSKSRLLFTDAEQKATVADVNALGGFDLRNVTVQRSGEGVALQWDEEILRALEAGDFKGLTPVFLGSSTVASPLAAMASQ